MSDIFISYAREDKDRVEILANALLARGWSVWWDPHIPTGKRYDEIIEEALTQARCIIVVWSTRSISSRYVRAEANEGADRQILLPVMIEDVKIPLIFRQIQTANLVDWQGSQEDPSFERLVEDIKTTLGMPPALPKPAAASASDVHAPIEQRSGFHSKKLKIPIHKRNFYLSLILLSAGVITALAIGFVVWYQSQTGQGPRTTNVNLATPTPEVSPTASPQPSVTVRNLSDLVKHMDVTHIAFYQGPCTDTEPEKPILNDNIKQANLSRTRWYVSLSFPRPSHHLESVVVLKFYNSDGDLRLTMTKRNAFIKPGWDNSWHCSPVPFGRVSLREGSYEVKVYVGPSPERAVEVGARRFRIY